MAFLDKYRCTDCGAVFNRDEADSRHECWGEFWGAPAYNDIPICPECRSDDLEDFEYPYEECHDYEDCDFNCNDCPMQEECNRQSEEDDEE